MAEIVEGGGGGGKHGKKKAKKGSARIDMTPMVDLAFLLLTFFVLAATLAKPKAMEIIYPKEVDDKEDKTKLDDALATTLLLGENENEVFYYSGAFKPDTTQLILTDLSKDGFRKIMLDKNMRVNDQVIQLKAKLESKEIDVFVGTRCLISVRSRWGKLGWVQYDQIKVFTGLVIITQGLKHISITPLGARCI